MNAVLGKRPTSSIASDEKSEDENAAKMARASAGGADGDDDMLEVGGRAKQYHCANCSRNVTGILRIRCEVTKLWFCAECFSVGVEIKGHKKEHPYRVVDSLSFPLYAPDWTMDEELLLLEGIEMYGLGNWRDVAQHVGTKGAAPCESHYTNVYLHSSTPPLPVVCKQLEQQLEGKRDSDGATSTDTLVNAKAKADEQMPAPAESEPASGTSSAEALATTSAPTIAGYMPLRGDFDVEHENDAELLLADMEFNDDDHPSEVELKLKVIAIYNAKLDERERRKRFVIERDLLDYKKHQSIERRRPRDERELVASMRAFARFHSAEEHEQLVNGLLASMRLRKRVQQLQHYRRMGMRSLAEARLYEAEKKRRDMALALRKQRQKSAYLYESGRTSGVTTARARDRTSRRAQRDSQGCDDAVDEQDGAEEEEGQADHEAAASSIGGAGTVASGHKNILDLTDAPGVELLSDKEKNLCQMLRLLPKHYIVVKDTLIRESLRLGFLQKGVARQLIKIDVSKVNQIYDFFIQCGWMRSEPAEPVSTTLENNGSDNATAVK